MELVNYSEAIADEVGFSKYLDPWNGDASKDLSVKEGQREWRDFICAESVAVVLSGNSAKVC